MYCKHCGREIDGDSSFCKYCGKPQDNRVSTPNSLIDFVYKKPILSSYILWVIINVTCLCRGNKTGEYYYILYPKFGLDGRAAINDFFDLDYYLITDFVVYAILIPLVIFLGCHYFKKVTSIKYRAIWALWFIINILLYNWSYINNEDAFYPFTHGNDYPYFYNNAYDLSELVVYTMIIPIAYWGYLYYKDRKKGTKDIK